MHKSIGLALVLVGVLGACAAPAEDEEAASTHDAVTATTGGLEDSYVTTSYPNQARGARPELKVGATGTVTQRAYLRFDVSGVPAGAVNVKATLRVYARTSRATRIEAHRSRSASFAERTLILANEPGQDPAVLSAVASTTANAWTTFDVSAAVSGNGTFGFVLSTPGGDIVELASKESGSSTAPKLVVTYDVAPTPTTDTVFGAAFNPRNDAGLNALKSLWGGFEVNRSFDNGNGVNPFLNNHQPLDLRHGVAVSATSFKYLPQDVLRGAHDADLRRFFQGIADDHPTYWTYWHEPDEDIFKDGRFTAPDYRAAWRHIKNIYAGVKANRPKLEAYATTIFMEYSLRPNIAPNRPLEGPNGMYPGDDVIDVFGIDSYNSGAEKGTVRDPASQWGKVIDFAKAHRKPWAVGEIGSCPVAGDPNGRARFLSGSIAYWKQRAYPPVYAAYFNVDWPTCDYRIDGDAAANAVWKKAMREGIAGF